VGWDYVAQITSFLVLSRTARHLLKRVGCIQRDLIPKSLLHEWRRDFLEKRIGDVPRAFPPSVSHSETSSKARGLHSALWLSMQLFPLYIHGEGARG